MGMRVVVPFGKKKMYTAVIYLVHSVTPTIYEAKDILCLLDNEPILRRPQMKFGSGFPPIIRLFWVMYIRLLFRQD